MTYKSAKEPWAHQRKALAKMRPREAFALFMSMRTGKTKTLLDDFGEREASNEVDDLLVIAPAGVYHTWLEAIQDHVGEALKKRLKVFLWSAGDGVEKKKELGRFLKASSPRILLLNIESLSRVGRAKKLAADFVGARRTMVAIDESTGIKSPSAKRAKFVAQVLGPLAEYRRILSGLPSPRSPLDIFQQFFFLDPKIIGYNNFATFRARYAIIKKMDFGGRWPAPIVEGYRDIDELQKIIEPYTFRATLEDCYEVPNKMYQFRDVEMTDDQRRFYDSLKHKATFEFSKDIHVTTTAVITQILRLHQILLGHVTDEEGITREIPENRTSELVKLLEEHDGKAIIWASYDYNIRKISERLEKEFGEGTVARFWGGNKNTREDEEKRFLHDPKCLFMVATPAAGGRGRTWTVANLIVYYSCTNDLEHRSQSEERAQAVGKKDPVLYIDMRVPGTVEEKIIKGLRKKIDLAAQITGDGWRSWLI